MVRLDGVTCCVCPCSKKIYFVIFALFFSVYFVCSSIFLFSSLTLSIPCPHHSYLGNLVLYSYSVQIEMYARIHSSNYSQEKWLQDARVCVRERESRDAGLSAPHLERAARAQMHTTCMLTSLRARSRVCVWCKWMYLFKDFQLLSVLHLFLSIKIRLCHRALCVFVLTRCVCACLHKMTDRQT